MMRVRSRDLAGRHPAQAGRDGGGIVGKAHPAATFSALGPSRRAISLIWPRSLGTIRTPPGLFGCTAYVAALVSSAASV